LREIGKPTALARGKWPVAAAGGRSAGGRIAEIQRQGLLCGGCFQDGFFRNT